MRHLRFSSLIVFYFYAIFFVSFRAYSSNSQDCVDFNGEQVCNAAGYGLETEANGTDLKKLTFHTTFIKDARQCKRVGSNTCYILKNPQVPYWIVQSKSKTYTGEAQMIIFLNSLLSFVDNDNNWVDADQQVAVQLAVNIERTDDYFKTVWNRNGINNHRSYILAIMYPNAPWQNASSESLKYKNQKELSKQQFTWLQFGKIYKENSIPDVSLEIVAHEYMHAIVASESDYFNGTVNEFYADIFAINVAAKYSRVSNPCLLSGRYYYTQEMPPLGIRTRENGLNVIRNLCNPNYVAHYSGRQREVHYDSGFLSLIYVYLLNGGTNHVSWISVLPIGLEKTLLLFYYALDNGYLKNTTTFSDFTNGILWAAHILFGQNKLTMSDINRITTAFDAVGVSPRISLVLDKSFADIPNKKIQLRLKIKLQGDNIPCGEDTTQKIRCREEKIPANVDITVVSKPTNFPGHITIDRRETQVLDDFFIYVDVDLNDGFESFLGTTETSFWLTLAVWFKQGGPWPVVQTMHPAYFSFNVPLKSQEN